MRILVTFFIMLFPAALSAQSLITVSEGQGWSFFPSISADGRYTVYECNGICRYDRVNENATVVHRSSSNWALQWPKVSADGEHICYMAGSQLYVFDVASSSVESIGSGMHCALSADGRYVAYEHSDGQTNIFLLDRQTDTTTLISRTAEGEQAGGYLPDITPDGRYIVFDSFDRLVPDDNNGANDIYLFDTMEAVAERISISSIGGATNGKSLYPGVSSDGRYVVFRSWASNLVDNDNNACDDVFVRDRQTQTTELISVSSGGVQQDSNNGFNRISTISGDGRFVAFDSGATNLVPGDTNGFIGVFLRDRVAQTTREVDVPNPDVLNSGGQANDEPSGALHATAVSEDGSWLAFQSQATNLVRNLSDSQHIFLAGLTSAAPTPTPNPSASPSPTGPDPTPSPTPPGDTDSDGDGVGDSDDGCPADANKTEPGLRGCGAKDPLSTNTVPIAADSSVNPPKVILKGQRFKGMDTSSIPPKKRKKVKGIGAYWEIVDLSSGEVVKHLKTKKTNLTLKNLPSGDYKAKYQVLGYQKKTKVNKKGKKVVKIGKIYVRSQWSKAEYFTVP